MSVEEKNLSRSISNREPKLESMVNLVLQLTYKTSNYSKKIPHLKT